jgi:hypothetical protein
VFPENVAQSAGGQPATFLFLSTFMHNSYKMTFIQDLLKPGGGIALIPFIRGTIATLLVLVM